MAYLERERPEQISKRSFPWLIFHEEEEVTSSLQVASNMPDNRSRKRRPARAEHSSYPQQARSRLTFF